MPHQCTDCGRAFDDGSKQMLSGCPDCGGNTFQFRPEGVESSSAPAENPPDRPEPAGEGTVARTVGSAATAVRDLVGGSPESPADTPPDPAPDDAPDSSIHDGVEPSASPPGSVPEDTAQASARSDIVEELPPAPDSTPTGRETDGTDVRPPEEDDSSGERPDLSELRAELNQQFESIKVLEPGQYELNLMELFDREEYIVALQEDGKYTIQVPERWED